MKNLLKYAKRKLFKRGVTVSLTLLYDCNLKCSYCSLKNETDKRPEGSAKHGAQYWINYINSFPVKVKEVFLTGGEPGLYKHIAELTNGLIKEGYFVTIFTNLTRIGSFMSIEDSPRLKFQATYHESMIAEIFDENYQRMNKYFRVDVDEIETNKFTYSNKKKFTNLANESETDRFRIDSDGAIYVSCYERNKRHL